MNLRAFTCCLNIILLLTVFTMPIRAASFSADMMDKRSEKTISRPFHYQDKSYSFEITDNERLLIVLVDDAAKMTRVLLPAEKLYYEIQSGDMRIAIQNPFTVFSYLAETNKVRTEGTETVSGLTCRKQVVSMNGQDCITAWISEEFGFPVRIMNLFDGSSIELQNIRREPQAKDFVSVPAGYTQVSRMPEPVPEWADKISSSPVLTPPFEKTLNNGEIIRLIPREGSQINIEAASSVNQPCTLTTVPFKGGRPLYNPMENTCTLEGESSMTITPQENPAEADEIILYVSRGSFVIKTKYEPNEKIKEQAENTPPPAALQSTDKSDTASIMEAPFSISVAAQFEVSWNGPGNKEDFISIARSNQPPGAYITKTMVREGNPLKIWAPSDPGNYEIRYIMGKGAKQLANFPIEITAVTAGVETSGPVNAADWITVKWNGPAVQGDFISVADQKQPPSAYINQVPVKNGNPARLRAPSDPGEYEVRYILGRGAKLLAKSSISINPVKATVTPPDTARCKTDFDVSWQGPGYAEDFICVARSNQPPGAYLSLTRVSKGNPLKIKAPLQPGDYEVRYILGRGNRLLSKAPIKIE